jgi:hypothetical protein
MLADHTAAVPPLPLLPACPSRSVITGAFFFIRSLLQYVNNEGWAGEKYTNGWLLTVFFFLDAYLLGEWCIALSCTGVAAG